MRVVTFRKNTLYSVINAYWYKLILNFMKPYDLIIPLFLFVIFFVPISTWADEIQQELYISQKGVVHIRGARLLTKHALNFITISIWKQKWDVITDYTTKFESAYGDPIKSTDIFTDHILEITGKPVADKVGTIDALLVRDLSLKTGTSTVVISSSILDVICPISIAVPLPLPSPALAPLINPMPATQFSSPVSSVSPNPYKLRITKNLYLGDKGQEVVVLQEFLQKNKLGIPSDGPVTGYLGKVTQKAIINFQKANGLAAVGIVGPKTRDLINSLIGK